MVIDLWQWNCRNGRGKKLWQWNCWNGRKKKLWQLICSNVVVAMEGKKNCHKFILTISATWLLKFFFFFFTNIKILEIKKKMGQWVHSLNSVLKILPKNSKKLETKLAIKAWVPETLLSIYVFIGLSASPPATHCACSLVETSFRIFQS